MTDKSGVDFDRRAFVRPQVPPTYPASRIGGVIVALALIAALAFIGYRLLPTASPSSVSADDASVAQLNQRLSVIEERLTKLEEERGAAAGVHRMQSSERSEQSGERREKVVPPIQAAAPARHSDRAVFRVSATPWQSAQSSVAQRPTAPTVDPATTQRLAKLQEGIGELQKNQTANSQAWQATTDRLADMAGQVGTDNVQILRNQDELNELVNRTEMEAIPFELLRGSNPTPVGPVSLVLKSTNPKRQSYTVCVYVQPSCIQLKDRMIHEVVQFVTARNSTPLEIVVTRIVKDEILGYLEVPRSQLAH